MEGQSDSGNMIKMSRPSREHRESKKRGAGVDKSSDSGAIEGAEGKSGQDRGASRGARSYSSRGRGGRGGSRGSRLWRTADRTVTPGPTKRLDTTADGTDAAPEQVAEVAPVQKKKPGRPRLNKIVAAVTPAPPDEEEAQRASQGTPASAGSPALDENGARRALRPRPSVTKSVTKRNKPFKQVTLKQEDAARIVGRRLKVYWPLDSKWYYGEVQAYCPVRERHRVLYDDKDEEWLDLQREDFKLQVHDWEVVGECGDLLAAAVKTPKATSGKKTRRRSKSLVVSGDESSIPSPSRLAEPSGVVQLSLESGSDDGLAQSEPSHVPKEDSSKLVSSCEGPTARGLISDELGGASATSTAVAGSDVLGGASAATTAVAGSGDRTSQPHRMPSGIPAAPPGCFYERRSTRGRDSKAAKADDKPKIVSVYTRRAAAGAPKSTPPAVYVSEGTGEQGERRPSEEGPVNDDLVASRDVDVGVGAAEGASCIPEDVSGVCPMDTSEGYAPSLVQGSSDSGDFFAVEAQEDVDEQEAVPMEMDAFQDEASPSSGVAQHEVAPDTGCLAETIIDQHLESVALKVPMFNRTLSDSPDVAGEMPSSGELKPPTPTSLAVICRSSEDNCTESLATDVRLQHSEVHVTRSRVRAWNGPVIGGPVSTRLLISLPVVDQGLRAEAGLSMIQSFLSSVQQLFGSGLPVLQIVGAPECQSGEAGDAPLQLPSPMSSLVENATDISGQGHMEERKVLDGLMLQRTAVSQDEAAWRAHATGRVIPFPFGEDDLGTVSGRPLLLLRNGLQSVTSAGLEVSINGFTFFQSPSSPSRMISAAQTATLTQLCPADCMEIIGNGIGPRISDASVSDVSLQPRRVEVPHDIVQGLHDPVLGDPVSSCILISLPVMESNGGLRVEASLSSLQSFLSSIRHLSGSRLPVSYFQDSLQRQSLASPDADLQVELPRGSVVDLKLCLQALRGAGIDVVLQRTRSVGGSTLAETQTTYLTLPSPCMSLPRELVDNPEQLEVDSQQLCILPRAISLHPSSPAHEGVCSGNPQVLPGEADHETDGVRQDDSSGGLEINSSPSDLDIAIGVEELQSGLTSVIKTEAEQQHSVPFKRGLEEGDRENERTGQPEADKDSSTPPTSSDSSAMTKRLRHEEVAATPTVERRHRFKLRRCPTNREWGIARDAQGTAAEDKQSAAKVLKPGARSVGCKGPEVDAGELPVVADASRKRPIVHCVDLPADRVNDPEATCSSWGEGAAGPCTHADDLANGETSKGNQVWVEGGLSGAPETRKRRKKGTSPVSGDDLDGTSGKGRRSDSVSPPVYEERTDRQTELPFLRRADSECTSCMCNVLNVREDRGWRDYGVTVELLSTGREMWTLAASLRGETFLTYKAVQVDATASSNKYTHALMFKAKKGMYLEFEDRKQWLRFKHMHELCYQRNARIPQIPIPGVKPIEECPAKLVGECFVRPPLEYIRQREREEEMGFQSNSVIYDMDTEDEQWLLHTNGERAGTRGSRSRPRISEDTLERIIERLERVSFSQKSEVSADYAMDICSGFGSPEVVKSVHAYWAGKRLRKGMALIRHFQAPPWQQYENQRKEWELKFQQLQRQFPSVSHKQLLEQCKAPAHFAFCLRPRGLESNKLQKQRSQRKQVKVGGASRQWLSLAGQPTPNGYYLDSPGKRCSSVEHQGVSGHKRNARHRYMEDSFQEGTTMDLHDVFTRASGNGNNHYPVEAMNDDTHVVTAPVPGSQVVTEKSHATEQRRRVKKAARKLKRPRGNSMAGESKRKRVRHLQQLDQQMQQESPMEVDLDTLREGEPSSFGNQLNAVDGSAFSSKKESSSGRVAAEQDSEEDPEAVVEALIAIAKEKRARARALRTRAQLMYATADATMSKAVQYVMEAECVQAAENAAKKAFQQQFEQDYDCQRECSQEHVGSLELSDSFEVSKLGQGKSAGQEVNKGPSFGSWRKGLENPSRTSAGLRPLSTRQSLVTDSDDPLLPVASWSQELGAGLGTRLIATGDASPQKK